MPKQKYKHLLWILYLILSIILIIALIIADKKIDRNVLLLTNEEAELIKEIVNDYSYEEKQNIDSKKLKEIFAKE